MPLFNRFKDEHGPSRVKSKISDGFPIIQREISHFHIFRVKKRDLSVYLSLFFKNYYLKRNYSVYFAKWV